MPPRPSPTARRTTAPEVVRILEGVEPDQADRAGKVEQGGRVGERHRREARGEAVVGGARRDLVELSARNGVAAHARGARGLDDPPAAAAAGALGDAHDLDPIRRVLDGGEHGVEADHPIGRRLANGDRGPGTGDRPLGARGSGLGMRRAGFEARRGARGSGLGARKPRLGALGAGRGARTARSASLGGRAGALARPLRPAAGASPLALFAALHAAGGAARSGRIGGSIAARGLSHCHLIPFRGSRRPSPPGPRAGPRNRAPRRWSP